MGGLSNNAVNTSFNSSGSMSDPHVITCPECSSKVAVVGQTIEKLKCLQCGAIVYPDGTARAGRMDKNDSSGTGSADAQNARERLVHSIDQPDSKEEIPAEQASSRDSASAGEGIHSSSESLDRQVVEDEVARTILESDVDQTLAAGPVSVAEDNIDQTVLENDLHQTSFAESDSGLQADAPSQKRAISTIRNAQEATHDGCQDERNELTCSPSVLESEDIGQTVNPRELSDHDATAWCLAAKSDSQESFQTEKLAAAPQRTWVDYQFRRLRQRTVTQSKDKKSTDDDYRLIRKLGQGGMGDVFVARQGSLNRLLAVKLIKPLDEKKRDELERLGKLKDVEEERRQQFLSEAIVTGDLDHPNIVPIHDVAVTSKNELFYSMKRVVGTPWSEVIKDNSRGQNLEILLKVCDAIGFAHDRGVVHRDIKPENIMLGDFGVVMVMDWGLALPTASYDKFDSIAATSSVGGTPSFMAPEMMTGPIDRIGVASDVYLLGATLFKLVTGFAPHKGRTVKECLQSVRRNTIREVTESDKGELLDIAMKAMRTKPDDRHPDVASFQKEIRAYREHAESVSLTARATDELTRGQCESSYEALSKAAFRYEEALKSWPENEKASLGLEKTKKIHAELACDNGDFDLALSHIDKTRADHQQLLTRISFEIRKRDSHVAKVKILRKIAAVLLSVILMGGSIAAYWIERARGIAVAEKERALDAEMAATREKERAVRAEVFATEQKQLALAETDRAVNAEKVAKKSTAIAYFQLANSRWTDSRVSDAREMLHEVPDEFRDDFEWHYCERHFLGSDVTLYGHKATVTSSSFSTDGTRVLSGSWDGTVKIWDAVTGKDIRTLKGHDGAVFYACLSPDGTRIASGGDDKYVKIWDALTGSELKSLIGHTDRILTMCFSPDSSLVASSGCDKTILIWDTVTGNEINTLVGHEAEVSSVVFSPDGTQVLSGSVDNTIKLWDVITGSEITTLEGHKKGVATVAFSPDGARIVSGGNENSLKIWDVVTRSEITTLKGHEAYITSVGFSPDGTRIVSASFDKTIKIWDVLTGNEVSSFKGHTDPVQSVGFSPDGRRIVSGSWDSTVKIWDAVTASQVTTLTGHDGYVTCASFSPDGTRVASGCWDNTIKIWDARTGHNRSTLKGHAGSITKVRFSPDGERLVSASLDKNIKLWDAKTGRELATLTGHEALVQDVSFSHDGKRLVSGGYDKTIKIWDVVMGQELISWVGHTAEVVSVCFNNDGTQILSGGADNNVVLWDAFSGKALNAFVGHAGAVLRATFSPNGKQVASASVDTTIKLWNSVTGDEIKTLKGHEGGVVSVNFNHRGNRIVSGSDDDTIKIWDVNSGDELTTLKGHTDNVLSTSFSPDGRRLISSSKDKTIKIWDATPGSEVTSLKGHTGEVFAVGFLMDGTRIVSASKDNTVKIWDPITRKEITTLKGHRDYVLSGNFSSDGALFVTGCRDSTIKMWQVDSGSEVFTGAGHSSSIMSVSFNQDSTQIVSGSGDKTLKIWDAVTGEDLFTCKGHTDVVSSVSFSPSGDRIVSGGWDRNVIIWDAATGIELKVLGGLPEKVKNVHFSPKGTEVVCELESGTQYVFDTESFRIVADAPWFPSDGVPTFTSPDGRWLVVPSVNDTLLIDLQFKNNPRIKAYRTQKSKHDPWWHREQGRFAAAAENWYAAAFHYGWAISLNKQEQEQDTKSNVSKALAVLDWAFNRGKQEDDPKSEFKKVWALLDPNKQTLLPDFIQKRAAEFSNSASIKTVRPK